MSRTDQAMKKRRISAKSIPIILMMDKHIKRCKIRGTFDCFVDAAADSLDGAVFRRELKDLLKRKMLKLVEYGFDDSLGRDLDRSRDPKLCGTSWSVNPTKRMIRTFWPDRLAARLNDE